MISHIEPAQFHIHECVIQDDLSAVLGVYVHAVVEIRGEIAWLAYLHLGFIECIVEFQVLKFAGVWICTWDVLQHKELSAFIVHHQYIWVASIKLLTNL